MTGTRKICVGTMLAACCLLLLPLHAQNPAATNSSAANQNQPGNWQPPANPNTQLPPESQEYLQILQKQPETNSLRLTTPNTSTSLQPAAPSQSTIQLPSPAPSSPQQAPPTQFSQPNLQPAPMVIPTGTASQPAGQQHVQPANYVAPISQADHSTTPLPLKPLDDKKPIPLAGPGEVKPKTSGTWSNLGTMLLSLGFVLLLFLITMRLLKKTLPGGKQQLARGVVEVLGSTPFGHRQTLQVVRFGNKILLVAVSQTGSDTLTEITDPLEVDRLAGICQQQSSQSVTSTFRDLLSQITSTKPVRDEQPIETVAANEKPSADQAIEAVRARLRSSTLGTVSLTTREVQRD